TPAVGRYATAPERPRTTFTEAGARSRRRSVDDHFPALHGEREITARPRLLRAEGRITPPFVAAEPVPPDPSGHPDLMPDRSAALRVRGGTGHRVDRAERVRLCPGRSCAEQRTGPEQ